MNSDDLLRQDMGKRMKDKYDKYWGNWHEPATAEIGRNVNESGRGKEKEKDIRFGLLFNHVLKSCLRNIGSNMLQLMRQLQPMILKN